MIYRERPDIFFTPGKVLEYEWVNESNYFEYKSRDADPAGVGPDPDLDPIFEGARSRTAATLHKSDA